jgi:hypothetical protein
MAQSQPFALACQGGLNKVSSQLELLRTPGEALNLSNFEVATTGGYRRVSGYSQFGDGTRPNGSNAILGLQLYADGLIACSGTNVYFSQDGDSWLQINRDSVAGGGDNYSTFTGRSALVRTSQGQADFTIFEGNTDYGELIITDKGTGAKPFYFKMTGTGDLADRTFFSKEITVDSSTYPKFCVIYDKHLVVAGAGTAQNTIYYSGTSDIDDFTTTGSGSILLDDQVVGLRAFRDDLIIFCRDSIYKLVNINNSSTIAVTPITKSIGCLDGASIQEVGGQLLFLAPDGIRTIAGTARIGDVELGSLSRKIVPIFTDIAADIGNLQINSAVIRKKSQYRLFYGNIGTSTAASYGVVGTLRIDPQGGSRFEWAELVGMQASQAFTSGFNYDNVERIYHGDYAGYVYNHDTGDSFNPAGVETAVDAVYETPDMDFGDLGTLKTLKYIKISASPEGSVQPYLRVRYDYEDSTIPQPDAILLSTIPKPAIFGSGLMGTSVFGAGDSPMVRQALQGSGTTAKFKFYSNDTKGPYTINGLYIDYQPSGRR